MLNFSLNVYFAKELLIELKLLFYFWVLLPTFCLLAYLLGFFLPIFDILSHFYLLHSVKYSAYYALFLVKRTWV